MLERRGWRRWNILCKKALPVFS